MYMANIETRVKALEKALIPLEDFKLDCRINFIRSGDGATVSTAEWVNGEWVHTVLIPETDALL